jgi:hypothetical protein
MSPLVAPPPGTRDEVASLVASMGAELDTLSRLLADAIHEHLDELFDDLYVQTLQSCRANLGLINALLRDNADPYAAVVPREALSYAKAYVRLGLPFDVLQRAYRMGQKTLTARWVEQLRAADLDADTFAAALGYFNDWLFAYVETIERQLTDFYMREREQWLRGAEAIRAETIRALLDGAPADELRLGYELDRDHVAFIVWSDEDGDGQELFAELERVAAAVAHGLGAAGVLSLAQGRQLACWAGVDGSDVVPYRPRRGIHVAIGSRGHGVEGFRRSHHEAQLAHRIAALTGGRAVTGFGEIALDALATADLDEARRFVAAELGPLAGDDDATRRLSSTLRVFLEEGASYVRAARRLGVHENTVTYRVHRAEDLLGRRVSERQLELRVALRLSRLL